MLIGSGETSRIGGCVFEKLAARIDSPQPPRIAVLETPAGFEPNSEQVAGRIAGFLRQRLGNFHPVVEVVPARRRGTPFSPDDPALIDPILRADMIFLGPGSPTYAARQLRGSLAWNAVLARHRLGATVVLASAAMIAAGALSLPVYEIYKVGEPPHWLPGLDLFGAYGLSLVFMPHWNNRDGGAELDTSRCYMGRQRFGELNAMLPPDRTVVGVDESTMLVAEVSTGHCEVVGEGAVTVIRGGSESRHVAGQTFDLGLLGPFVKNAGRGDVPVDVWEAAVAATADTGQGDAGANPPEIPGEVLELAEARRAARGAKDWAGADALRERIAALGWRLLDGPDGARLDRISHRD